MNNSKTDRRIEEAKWALAVAQDALEESGAALDIFAPEWQAVVDAQIAVEREENRLGDLINAEGARAMLFATLCSLTTLQNVAIDNLNAHYRMIGV